MRSCAWSPDGTRLLSGSDDNTVKVWDAPSGQCLLTLQGHQNRVMACAWSPSGTRLGWRWLDPELGRLRLLPAETFGPLPS